MRIKPGSHLSHFSQKLLYFVKNLKDEIWAKIRVCTVSSTLMLKKLEIHSGKVRSEIGSHLTETDLNLLIFMSNGSHLGRKKYLYVYILYEFSYYVMLYIFNGKIYL